GTLGAGVREQFVGGVPAGGGELRERRCEAMHRVVGKLWIRDVSLRAMDGQPARQRSAASDFVCVAEDFVTAGLADGAPVDVLVARLERFDDPPRAVDRRTFLVA